MNREQAMTLLKELVAKDLVEPSYVHISDRVPKRIPNEYQIQIKARYNRSQLEDFCKKNGLTIREDEEEKYLIIFKP